MTRITTRATDSPWKLRCAPHLGIRSIDEPAFARTLGTIDPKAPVRRAAALGFAGVADNLAKTRPPSSQAQIGAELARAGLVMSSFVGTEGDPLRGDRSPAALDATSVTTGRPGAVRRLPADDAEVDQCRRQLELVHNGKPGRVAISAGPPYHPFSLAVAMYSSYKGRTSPGWKDTRTCASSSSRIRCVTGLDCGLDGACLLPGRFLHPLITARLRDHLPGGFELHLDDPRESD